MANNVVKFLITGDAAGIVDAAERAGASIEKIGPSGSKAGKLINDGLKVAVVGLAGLAANSVKVALEGEKSQAILDTAIKNTGASLAAVGPQYAKLEAAGAKYGETNDQVRQGLATLVTATGDTDQAAKLLGITQDIAAAKNISLSAAAKLVGKVSEGNVGSLGRFGLATKDSAGNTLTAAAALQELQTKFHGVSDEIAKTPAGKLAAFHAQFEDLEENIGTKLLPLITRFGGDAVQFIGDAEHAFDGLTGGEKKALEIAGGVALGGLAIYKAWGPISTLVGGIQKAYGFLSGTTKAAAEQEIAEAEERAAAEQAAADESNAAFSSMGETFTAAASTITGAVEELIAAIGRLDASIATIGTAATEAATVTDAAFTGMAASAATLGTEIEAAKAASNVGVWGGGGLALGAGAGSGALALGSGAAGGQVIETGLAGEGVVPSIVGGGGGLGSSTLLSGGILAALALSLTHVPKEAAPADAQKLAKGFEDNSSVISNSAANSAISQQGRFKVGQTIPLLQQDLSNIDPASKAYATEAANIDKLTAALGRSYGVTHVAGGIQEAFTTAIGKTNAGLISHVAGLFNATKADGSFATALHGVEGAAIGNVTAFDSAATAIAEHAKATGDDELATKNSAAALKTYGSNLTDTLNPVLSAIGSENDLTTAKTNASYANLALAEAVKQYGKNSPQAIQATQDLAAANTAQVTAAVNEQSALVNLAQTYQDSGKSTDDFKGALQGLVAQGAITQDQANGMTLAFAITKAQLDKIPASKSTDLTATDHASGTIAGIKSKIDGLAGKTLIINADPSPAEYQLGLFGNVVAADAQSWKNQLGAKVAAAIGITNNPTRKISGAFAGGGNTLAGHLYEVAEAGRSETLHENGHTYLIAGSPGVVAPISSTSIKAPASSATYKAAPTIVNQYTIQVNVPVNADPAATGKALMQALHDADRAGAPVANGLKQLVNG